MQLDDWYFSLLLAARYFDLMLDPAFIKLMKNSCSSEVLCLFNIACVGVPALLGASCVQHCVITQQLLQELFILSVASHVSNYNLPALCC